MKTQRRWFLWPRLPLLAGFLNLLASCSLESPYLDICREFESLQTVPVLDQGVGVVFEDPGTIVVQHGFACARSDNGRFIKVEQSLDIPDYANQATVLLNGWRMNYSDDDHHVLVLTSVLGKIRFDQPRGAKKLTWQAIGILADENLKRHYGWCYYYTAIAWNQTKLHAVVDNGDADQFCKSGPGSNNFFLTFNRYTTTALSCFLSFMENPSFASSRKVAVLPRGFGFGWTNDHHLLQIACNVDASETFIAKQRYKKADTEVTPLQSPNGRADAGFVSWNTSAIFKDNDSRRDYMYGELVSGMAGSDVDVLQPAFPILPQDSMGFFGACLGESPGIKTEQITIDNIPYAYAIPMLTGWELSYPCKDHHVKEIGIWIDDLHYDQVPNSGVGTLRYRLSSVLDDTSDNGHAYRHKVSVLELKPLTPPPLPPTRLP